MAVVCNFLALRFVFLTSFIIGAILELGCEFVWKVFKVFSQLFIVRRDVLSK